jgi:hypothetical protein
VSEDPRCDARQSILGQALEALTRQTCPAEDQLRSIRATLLVNFSDTPRNIWGFCVKDEGTTHDMLFAVLIRLAADRIQREDKP